MDPLRKDDIARGRRTTPARRLALALELSAAGIELERTTLRIRFPRESADELEARLERWLTQPHV